MYELGQRVITALLNQHTLERQSEAVYLAAHNALAFHAFDGFAKWCLAEAAGERAHAKEVATYLISRNVMPTVAQLDAVDVTLDVKDLRASLIQLFQRALKQEGLVSTSLDNLHDTATQDADTYTCVFLQPMLMHQLSAERELTDLIALLTFSDCPAGVLRLDREYGELTRSVKVGA